METIVRAAYMDLENATAEIYSAGLPGRGSRRNQIGEAKPQRLELTCGTYGATLTSPESSET